MHAPGLSQTRTSVAFDNSFRAGLGQPGGLRVEYVHEEEEEVKSLVPNENPCPPAG